MFGDLFLSSCPGMGKDLLGDIQIIKDLNIKCLISLVEENELTNLGAKDLFKELDKNNIITISCFICWKSKRRNKNLQNGFCTSQ